MRKNTYKKTVKARPLILLGNGIIANNLGEDDESRGIRRGAINFIERVLHDSDSYDGFRYLDAEGNTYLGPFDRDHDGTRRAYYVHREG